MGGAVLPTGNGSMAALAVVVTVTGTLTDDPAATVSGEAGPLQAAEVGAPEQVIVTLKGLPVAASCRAKVADWPALIVAALPPEGTVSDRLPAAEPAVTLAVAAVLAPLLSVTVAVTV